MLRPRKAPRYTVLILLLLIGSRAEATTIQEPAVFDATARRLALEKLRVLGSVLYVGAHPDDENTALLAALARGRGIRSAYLSLTRGDGGQNLLGTEQGERLGVIRTEELLAARRIDGAEQFFTRAIDFGYSKSAEESLRLWGRDAVLSDAVWVIRSFRPDVIVTRFPTTGEGGHGHHIASSILAMEAFNAAADPTRFPEQLRLVQPWRAKRILWNAWRWRGSDDTRGVGQVIRLETGTYDPLLGRSYTELAALGRSMHKSQGFGVPGRRGPAHETFVHLAGDPADADLFDGIDTSWNRVPGGNKVAAVLDRALAAYRDDRPADVVPLLLETLSTLETLADDPWIEIKRRELLVAVRACLGLWLEAIASAPQAAPGSTLEVKVTAINRSPRPLTLQRIEISHAVETRNPEILETNQPMTRTLTISLPADAPYSHPYWLESDPIKAAYAMPDQSITGLPGNPPALSAHVSINVEDRKLPFDIPVLHRSVDPVAGERYRAFAIVPRVTASLEERLLLFPDRSPRILRARVCAHNAKRKVVLRLDAPDGFQVRPPRVPVTFDAPDQERLIEFTIEPPEGQAVGDLRLVLIADKEEPARELVAVEYDHIEPQVLLPPAVARAVRVDVIRPVSRIGYVMGSGDAIPAVLRQIGFEVRELTDDELEWGDLALYETLVVGVRAFNTRASLARLASRLQAYVKAGGTLVVQYNTSRGLLTSGLGPYPLSLTRNRVTDENAPVILIKPDHPLLQTPFRVVSKDFEDWVQERGLYFAGDWDATYDALLRMNDPGEPPLDGALLHARYGRGAYVYTGLSFFRQLPAGIPGAIRLFVNLLAGGHEHE